MDPKAAVIASSLLALMGLAGCSESSSSSKDVVPDSGYGTEGLDSLGSGSAPEPEAADEPVEIDQSTPQAEDAESEEDREWTKARESQSLLGRSRDKAKTLRNDIQGGTNAPEEGFALTNPDEEWVATGGWVWDMPEDWQMAIPASGRFGEMYVPSQLGAASVAFTRETDTVAQLERRVGSMLVDMIGSKVAVRTESDTVGGLAVKTLGLEGTYVDPSAKGGSNEKPFYAVRAAIIDLGEARALIVLWGPEQTVINNENAFASMIRGMHAE